MRIFIHILSVAYFVMKVTSLLCCWFPPVLFIPSSLVSSHQISSLSVLCTFCLFVTYWFIFLDFGHRTFTSPSVYPHDWKNKTSLITLLSSFSCVVSRHIPFKTTIIKHESWQQIFGPVSLQDRVTFKSIFQQWTLLTHWHLIKLFGMNVI